MVKVKLKKSKFGFDEGETYDAHLCEISDVYMVINGTFRSPVKKDDVEVIND